MTTFDFTKAYWQQPFANALHVDMRAIKIDATGVEKTLLSYLPDTERDLIDVAMAVYTADCMAPRSSEHPKSWVTAMTGRKLHVRVGVRQPHHWQRPDVYQNLTETLAFFTGDDWTFDFLAKKSEGSVVPLFSQEFSRPFVGLFSGGLDSYAGAVTQVLESDCRTGVVVAAYTNGKLLARQRELLRKTNDRLAEKGKRLVHVPLRHNLEQTLWKTGNNKERSQRSRGFLFMALGLAVTRTLGLQTLNVYENGVGAINLPQTVSGLGVDYTRAMHPEGLLKMAAFVSSLFEAPIRVDNPSLWKTKGQMCQEVQKLDYGDLAVRTVSCDGYGGRRKAKGKEQCGLCTSCILRRVSLAAGDLREMDMDEETYEWDVYGISPTQRQKENLLPLRCMESQAERLQRALTSPNPEKELLNEFPELIRARVAIASSEGRSIPEVMAELAKLFRSYVGEWDWFSTWLPGPAHEEAA